ncbi:MAG: TlpA family protein disulfide reductase [Muribaculaceae bacterium]|nr:TlpA family protein disulfide reductase [Muribaculaceae bacterium]
MKKITMLIMGALLAIPAAFAELPSVQLKDVNGNTVNTAQLSNDGKPMVISFWATWCKPCKRELKAIQEVYPDWQDETGVKLIAVSIDEAQNIAKVKPFVEGSGWEYEVLLDPNGEFKRQMGVSDVPHAFIIDGQGNVVWNHKGYVDGGEEEIIEKLRELTGK